MELPRLYQISRISDFILDQWRPLMVLSRKLHVRYANGSTVSTYVYGEYESTSMCVYTREDMHVCDNLHEGGSGREFMGNVCRKRRRRMFLDCSRQFPIDLAFCPTI